MKQRGSATSCKFQRMRAVLLVGWLLQRQSPASHRGGPGSSLGQVMRDLWWAKWHWGQIFSECFGFPCQFAFQRLLQNYHHHLGLVQ
jgi:hypothetical protein